MLSIASYQKISLGFALKRVGVAILTLGYENKERAYTTIYTAKSAKDLAAARELISGVRGNENVKQFWLCFRLTCRRLSEFIWNF